MITVLILMIGNCSFGLLLHKLRLVLLKVLQDGVDLFVIGLSLRWRLLLLDLNNLRLLVEALLDADELDQLLLEHLSQTLEVQLIELRLGSLGLRLLLVRVIVTHDLIAASDLRVQND